MIYTGHFLFKIYTCHFLFKIYGTQVIFSLRFTQFMTPVHGDGWLVVSFYSVGRYGI